MELPSAYGIELSSFVDLVRLITSSSPDRPSTIFKWKIEGEKYFYSSFAIFPGYFDYRALPVLFFITTESELEEEGQSLVRYDLQKSVNQITFLQFLKEQDLENAHTGLIRFIPIINLKSPPTIFTNLA
ncbi:hypothetical protein CEE45_05710 [Candidatus Heimdallarchaeota archaeon B3_Heim]|nr:MAG: hypothetical protein CEE45_05710 [Candidatus Heimdallarchaeota archaeon B3_Heim]